MAKRFRTGKVFPLIVTTHPYPRSKQLEIAVPVSAISSLSAGEFVGMVADNPDQIIELKTFHCEIINNHEELKQEQDKYTEIPVIRKLDNAMVQRNYNQIKLDIRNIVVSEMDRLMLDPELKHLVIKKGH